MAHPLLSAALLDLSRGGWRGGGTGTAVILLGQRDSALAGAAKGAPVGAFVLGHWGLWYGHTQSCIVWQGQARSCSHDWPATVTPVSPAFVCTSEIPGSDPACHPPSWLGPSRDPLLSAQALLVIPNHNHCLSLAGSRGRWTGITPHYSCLL